MDKRPASELLAISIMLAHEVNAILRECVNNPDLLPGDVCQKLDQAANKANTLSKYCTKTKRLVLARK